MRLTNKVKLYIKGCIYLVNTKLKKILLCRVQFLKDVAVNVSEWWLVLVELSFRAHFIKLIVQIYSFMCLM